MTKARCKTLWRPIPCPLSDIEGLESWLGDMAAQGLVPVTIGQNFARFRRSQPKAVRYRLNAKPAPETLLESAPGTPDGEERALAQECGWYYITAVGDFFLYACEDSDAPELNTDPQVQALSLRYAKRQVFAPAGLLAYWLVTFWVRYAMGIWHTPVIDFVTLGWLSFCYLGLLAAALASVVHNTVLLYRFSARLTRGAEPERHKNWRKGAGRYLVGRVLAALLFVLTIVWTFAGSAMEKSRHGSIPLEDRLHRSPAVCRPGRLRRAARCAGCRRRPRCQLCAGTAASSGPDLYQIRSPRPDRYRWAAWCIICRVLRMYHPAAGPDDVPGRQSKRAAQLS